MYVAVLGPLELRLAHGPVALGAPRRAVLEMLALRAGQPVPTKSLWSGLWGDSAPPSAAKVLQSHISHLRHVLPPGAIATVGSGYLLQLDHGAVDASRFERSLQEAAEQRDAGDLAEAVGTLVDGPRPVEGRPLPGADRALLGHRRGGAVGGTSAGRPRTTCRTCDWRSASTTASSATSRPQWRASRCGNGAGPS